MEVYIQEKETKIKREKGHFIIFSNNKNTPVAVDRIDSIIIEENCSITTNAMKLAIENKIPIYLSDGIGNIFGKILGEGFDKSTMIRKKQLEFFYKTEGKEIARKWIIEKIETQRNHARKLYGKKSIDFFKEDNRFSDLIANIEKVNLAEENYQNIIMGYEGVASHLYYSCIGKVLPENIKFKNRINEGANDVYNVVLNYSFGILYTKVNHILTINGLDTKIGILHSNMQLKDSLVYDFIEPFRIICWEAVFGIFSKKLFNKSYFDSEEKLLSKDGRRLILEEVSQKLKREIEFNGEKYSYNELIKLKAKNLIKELLEL